MCSGACAGDCNCAASVPRGPRGFQGPPGATPTITIGTVTALPPGSTPTVTNTGSDLEAVLNWGVVTGNTGATGATGAAGTNGTPGVNAFTSITGSYTQPDVGDNVSVTFLDASWIGVNQIIYIETGGYYLSTGPATGNTKTLTNLGYPGNAAPGFVVLNPLVLQPVPKVSPGGYRGPDGATGASGVGVNALVPIVNTIPVTPPVPGQETVIYQNDPTTPTIMRFYYYSSGSWTAGANFVGAAGTQVTTTPGNPNATLPAGPVGTLAFRTDVPSLWLKTGTSTWTLQFNIAPTFQQVATTSAGDFGTVPTSTQRVIGYVTLADTHTTPATTYTFDLAYQSVYVEADVDIELDFDASTYTQGADWTWQIENVDGSPINVTFASSVFDKKTGLSLPTTLAAGAVQTFILRRTKAKILIVDTFVNDAV